MAPRTTPGKGGEQGFTLAAVIVIMSIVLIFAAYTVPRMWSTVMMRERDLETAFIMKQYARAIYEFQIKHNAYPTTMDQLKDARQPRFLRGGPKGEILDPLTGQYDWMLIPAAAAGQQQMRPIPNPNQPNQPNQANQPQQPPTVPAVSMKDYGGGPFIGVRPAKTGKSFIALNGADQYDQWTYTAVDYKAEVEAHRAAAAQIYR